MRSQTNNDWAEDSAGNPHRPSDSDIGRYTDNSHSTSQDATRSQSREGRGSGSVPQAPSRRSENLPRSGRGQRPSGVRVPDASPPPRLPMKYALERTSTAAFPGVAVGGNSASRREALSSVSEVVYEDDSDEGEEEEDDAEWSDATTDDGDGGVEVSSTRALVFDHDSSSRNNAAAPTTSLSPTTKAEMVTRPTAVFGAPPLSSRENAFRRGTPVARVAYSAGYTPAAGETSEESSSSVAKSPSNPPAAAAPWEKTGFTFLTGSAADAAAATETQPSFSGFGGNTNSSAGAQQSSFFQQLPPAAAAPTAAIPSAKAAVAFPGVAHAPGKKNEHPLDFPPSSASPSLFPKPGASTAAIGGVAAATAAPTQPIFGAGSAAEKSAQSLSPFFTASAPSPFSPVEAAARPQPSPFGATTTAPAAPGSEQPTRPFGFPSAPQLSSAFGASEAAPAAGSAAAGTSVFGDVKNPTAFSGTKKQSGVVPASTTPPAPFGRTQGAKSDSASHSGFSPSAAGAGAATSSPFAGFGSGAASGQPTQKSLPFSTTFAASAASSPSPFSPAEPTARPQPAVFGAASASGGAAPAAAGSEQSARPFVFSSAPNAASVRGSATTPSAPVFESAAKASAFGGFQPTSASSGVGKKPSVFGQTTTQPAPFGSTARSANGEAAPASGFGFSAAGSKPSFSGFGSNCSSAAAQPFSGAPRPAAAAAAFPKSAPAFFGAAATAAPAKPFFGNDDSKTGPAAAASSPFSSSPFPPASSPSPFSPPEPAGRPQPSPFGAATANTAAAESGQAARPFGFPSAPNVSTAFGAFTAPSAPAAGGAAAGGSSFGGFKTTPAFQGTEKKPNIVPTHAMGAPFGGGVQPAPADATLGNGFAFAAHPPITKSIFTGFGSSSSSKDTGGEAQPTCADAFQQPVASFPMSASVLPGATFASAKPTEHLLTFHPPVAAAAEHFAAPVGASTLFGEAAAAATQATAATPFVQPAFGGSTVPGLAAHGHPTNVFAAAVTSSPAHVSPAEPPVEAPPPPTRPVDVFCVGVPTAAASTAGSKMPPAPSSAEETVPTAGWSTSSPQNPQRPTVDEAEQVAASPFSFSPVDYSTLVASPVCRQSKNVEDDVSDTFDVDGAAVCASPAEGAASTSTDLVAAGRCDTVAQLLAHATKTRAAAERIVQAACEREAEEEGEVVPASDVASRASPPQLVPSVSSTAAAGGAIPKEDTVAKAALPTASRAPAAVQVTITHIYNCTQEEQSWLQGAGSHAVPARILQRARTDGLTSTPSSRAPATAPPRQQLEVALYCRPLLVHLPNPPLHTSLLCAAGQHDGLRRPYAVVRFVWRTLLPFVLRAVFSVLFALLLVVTGVVVLDRVHAEYPVVALWVAEVRRYAQSVSVEGVKGWVMDMAAKMYP